MNIIRIIKLTNRNVAFWHEEMGYSGTAIAWGYHDRIATEKIHKEKPKLKEMWYADIRAIMQGNGKSAVENIYVFRNEDEDSDIRDERFWEKFGEKDDDFPFIFVTFIRFNAVLSSITNHRKRFEEALQDLLNREDPAVALPDAFARLSDVCKGITYSTTDVSDIVLVLRSKSHKIAAALIEALSYLNFPLCTIKNTAQERGGIKIKKDLYYTISAFSASFIEKEGDQTFLNDPFEIQIRLKASRAEEWYDALKRWVDREGINGDKVKSSKGISCQSVLGNEDFIVSVTGLTWQGMRQLYKDFYRTLYHDKVISYFSSYVLYPAKGSGDGNKENEEFIKWIVARFEEAGKMKCLEDVANCGAGCKLVTSGEDLKTISATWNFIRCGLQARLMYLQEKKFEYDAETGFSIVAYKSVLQTLNYLEKYGSINFPQYGYMIVLDSFLGIVDNMLNYNIADKSHAYEQETRFLSLLISINSVLQNSIRAERQDFATPEVNSAIADMPPKLIAMHASFLQKLQRLLKDIGRKTADLHEGDDNTREYSVLYYPSVTPPESKEMTRGNASSMHRLNIVRTNAQFAMDIKNLWLISAHEMAHKVGRELRSRCLRFDIVISLCLYAFFDCEVRRIVEGYNQSRRQGVPEMSIPVRTLNQIVEKGATKYLDAVKEYCNKKYDPGVDGFHERYYKATAKRDIFEGLYRVLFPLKPDPDCFDWMYYMLCSYERTKRPPMMNDKEHIAYEKGFKDFKAGLAAAVYTEQQSHIHGQFDAPVRKLDDKGQTLYLKDDVTLANLVVQSYHFIDEVFADVVGLLLTGASPKLYVESLASQYAAMGRYEKDPKTNRWIPVGIGLDRLRLLCAVQSMYTFEKVDEQQIAAKSWEDMIRDMKDEERAAGEASEETEADETKPKYDLCRYFSEAVWDLDDYAESQAEGRKSDDYEQDLPNYGEYIFQSSYIERVVIRFMLQVIRHFTEKTHEAVFHERVKENSAVNKKVREKEGDQVGKNADLLERIRKDYAESSDITSVDAFVDTMYRLNYDLYHHNMRIIRNFYDKTKKLQDQRP